MKAHLIACCLLALTAYTQCSDKKKEQAVQIKQEEKKKDKVKKKIQSVIYYFDYYPDPITFLKKDYPEHLRKLYNSYCYKTIEHYSFHSFPYKGDIVNGQLTARVYKKDGSFFEFPLTVYENESNLMKSDFNRRRNNIRMIARLSYSGEEVRLEVRRINKEKNEDVLLYETRIADLNDSDSRWEDREDDYVPKGGGFGKESQCHATSGN